MDQVTIANSFDLTEDERKIVSLCYTVVNVGVPMPGSNLMRVITKLHDYVKFLEVSTTLHEPEDLAEQRVKAIVREIAIRDTPRAAKFVPMGASTTTIPIQNKLQDRYGNR